MTTTSGELRTCLVTNVRRIGDKPQYLLALLSKKLAWLKPQIPKQERHMFSNYLKYFTALLLTVTFCTAVAADEQLSKIEKAYQAVDAATLTTLIEAAQGNNQFVAQYRLISLNMGSNQMDKAQPLLNELKSDLEAETKANPGNA